MREIHLSLRLGRTLWRAPKMKISKFMYKWTLKFSFYTCGLKWSMRNDDTRFQVQTGAFFGRKILYWRQYFWGEVSLANRSVSKSNTIWHPADLFLDYHMVVWQIIRLKTLQVTPRFQVVQGVLTFSSGNFPHSPCLKLFLVQRLGAHAKW